MPQAPPDIVSPSSVAPLGQLPFTGQIDMAENCGGVTSNLVALAPPVPRTVMPSAITYPPAAADAVYVPGARFSVHGLVDTAMIFTRMSPVVVAGIDWTVEPFAQFAEASRVVATTSTRLINKVVQIVDAPVQFATVQFTSISSCHNRFETLGLFRRFGERLRRMRSRLSGHRSFLGIG
jgi:hypothetical protein